MDGTILVNNIRALCKKKNISITKLESDLFLSPGLISRWSKNIPSVDKVMDIATYLGVSIDELVKQPQNAPEHRDIERLLFLLYNRTLADKTEWEILNFQAPPKELKNISSSTFFPVESCDCYYTNYLNGFFFLASTHLPFDSLQLRFFILPDPYCKPNCVCSDTNQLTPLYEYLSRHFSKQINKIKSDNFIAAFIKDAASANSSDEDRLPSLIAINTAGNF